MKDTDELTDRIVDFCLRKKCWAWRENTLPVPIVKGGVVTGFRSGGISGKPDVFVLAPPEGVAFGFEVKTGKDRARESQVGFKKNWEIVTGGKGRYFFVRSFEEFLELFNKYICYEEAGDTECVGTDTQCSSGDDG